MTPTVEPESEKRLILLGQAICWCGCLCQALPSQLAARSPEFRSSLFKTKLMQTNMLDPRPVCLCACVCGEWDGVSYFLGGLPGVLCCVGCRRWAASTACVPYVFVSVLVGDRVLA
jgi:hypothetical protein